MKKSLAMLLMLVLALSCVPLASADDVPVLTVAVPDKTNIEDYNTNQMTLCIEEKLGVDLDIHVYDSTDYISKMNLMIQSGDKLEDILVFNGTPGDNLIAEWAQLEAIVPLTAYYADPEISPWIHDAYERVGYDFSGLMIMPDGEIYAIPTLNQSYGNEHGNGRVWVYKPWLEALDAEMPTTTEELKAVLEKAVATDLNGNGIADEMGLVGYNGVSGQWFNYLMDAFIPCIPAKDWMIVRDGTVSFAYTAPEWRQGLEFIKSLYDEGLMPTENLTQDNKGFGTMISSPDVTCFATAHTTCGGMSDLERRGKYFVVPPLTGPNGFSSTTYEPSVPAARFFVSGDCENPELVIQMIDWLFTEEGSRLASYGIEGEAYNLKPDGTIELTELITNNPAGLSSNTAMIIYAGDLIPCVKDNSRLLSTFDENTIEAIEFASSQEKDGAYNMPSGLKTTFTQEENDIYAQYSPDLLTYMSEHALKFLMGEESLDNLPEFKQTLHDLHIDEIIGVYQAAYDRMMAEE